MLSTVPLLVATFALSTFSTTLALLTVDLGYAVHRATLNETGQYYSFSNIRYAEPPVGELRFSKPVYPKTVNRTVNDGTLEHICAQAYPEWLLLQLAEQYGGTTEGWKATLLGDLRINEDCLFLDVIVPKDVFDNAQKKGCKPKLAPVLVWLYGGGFTSGYKINYETNAGNPAGLIARSKLNNQESIVFVAFNYRLGMFGWLAGDENITPNAGMWDQRLAFTWVQKNIRLFGGDPGRVTVMGESAGGASILHHITAFGGQKAAFGNAILQSPAFNIAPDAQRDLQATFVAASNLTGSAITTVDQLRSLDFAVLRDVNQAVVGAGSPKGTFLYGPLKDGSMVPDLPGIQLLKGDFDHSVKVMAGHNLNESKLYSPIITTDAEFKAHLTAILPGISSETINYIDTVIYSDVVDGSHGYTTEFGRLATLLSELFYTCATNYLANAFNNLTHNYRFQYPPGTHLQDVSYTFFNGEQKDPTLPVQPDLAHTMQDYFVQFTIHGSPNKEGLPAWPVYNESARILTFGTDGVGTAVDDTANARCQYWQSAPWRNTV